MNSTKPLDLVRMGCVSNEDYERSAPQLADIIKTAQMPVCRDVISLIKKIIKDKHSAPPSKLRALKLFHACMMVANTNFLIFAQRKVMSRFTILAKHRKQVHEDSRGDDMFGSVSGVSEENRQASREFLTCLLQYIHTWAQQFGKAPDGKPSAYLTAYNALVKENVSFPNKRNTKPRLSLDNPRKSLDNPRPSSAVPKQSSPFMLERSSQQAYAERSSIRKNAGGIQGRVEAAMNVYNDLLRSGGGGDAIVECFLQLKDLKSELEREVGQSDNPETIESLFELNDRLQMLIDSHHDIGKKPQQNKAYETVPVMPPQSAIRKQQIDNILDLDLFDDPPPSVSQSAAFSSMSFATHNPRSGLMPTEMQSPPSQNYPALLPTSVKDDAGAVESLKRENEKLKKVISHRQEEDSNKINQINLLMTENMQLKQALEVGKQNLAMQDENIKKLTAQSAQLNASIVEANQNIERLTRQLEAKENEIKSLKQGEKPNGHQTNLSQHTLPINPDIRMQAPQRSPDPYTMQSELRLQAPQRAPDPYTMAPELKIQIPSRAPDLHSSSPNPFDNSSDSSEDIPIQSHNFPIQNELFYRICNCLERGVLYDDEFLQVGMQIAKDENGIVGMIYVGNKMTVPITELNTEVISYEKEGLIVLINPIISTDQIAQGAQANRMVKASLKDFTGRIPKIIIKIKQGSETKSLFLNLPITIARFVQGINRSPEEFWPIWERLAFKEEKFSCQMQGIRSMQELSQHLSLGGAFKIFNSQEIPQLSPTQLLGAGQKGVAVLVLATIDPQTMSAQLAVRSESLTLREAIMEIISAQISGKE